ncbi:MAG: DNA polymerase I, partial [Pyrinomonadaceae bacterium]
RGQVTQAVFVFTNMLRKLLSDEKPHYIAAVFESGVPTFRHEMNVGYKANRVAPPEELESQIPYIVRVCEAYNVPVLNVPGFEADDVIGALAVQAAEAGLQSVIVSNDKDMTQLVRDPWVVCMRNNSQNVKRKEPVPPVEWCDEQWVENKFGVRPTQIVDLLGLMGDSVDNIPGAPGIGAKGAVAIVQQFGSVENALERWEEVKHKTYRESLRDNRDLILQSKDLATIRTDVNIKLDLDRLRCKAPDRAAAYKLFRELEFQTLTREFADAASEVDMGAASKVYLRVRKVSELEALVRKLWEVDHWTFAVSDSTPAGAGQQVSVRDGQPTGLAISHAPNTAHFIDFAEFEGGHDQAVSMLRDALSNGLLSKSVHDLKRAVALLAPLGVELEGVTDDTLLAAYLLDPVRSRYDLGDLAREALNLDEGWSDAPEGWAAEHWRAAEAADLTAQVADVLHGRVLEQGLEAIYNEIELPIAPLLYRIERAGLKVDTSVLGELSALFGAELEKLTAQIYKVAGREFKINSPKQVGEVLEELNISTKRKTATGQVSTSRAVLDELAAQGYELPRLLIEFRELDKLKATYTDALPALVGPDGRIHSELNQAVTATGRLSSSNPNLQNIPIRTELGRRIRRAFIPEKGNVFVAADYSQLELRLLAHVTRDEQMLDAFQKGEDIHERTARLVFGARTKEELKEKRRFAKIVNFAIAYAVEPFGLSQRVGISRKEARQVIDDYYETYSGVRRFMEEVPEKARETGLVRSKYGRIRPVPTINDRNGNIRARAEREAINMPIQGTASDIVKIAMLKVDEALRSAGLKAQMVMQVHDELLVEAPKKEAEQVREILCREMETAVDLDVPLDVESGTGDNWMDVKK